jgi:uncharacterized protein (TIGR04255 family)
MGLSTYYRNAPITEAIIDIRVEHTDDFDLRKLELTDGDFVSYYPNKEGVIESISKMEVGPEGGSTSITNRPIGWKFSSKDHKQIIQSRRNGFTFSRLAPYEKWEAHKAEAEKNWHIYRRMTNPRSINRLAVRFINKIDIQGECIEIKDYFRTFPEVSSELPQHLDGFFMQVQLPMQKISGQCLINQTIIPPEKKGIVSIILDIDVFSLNYSGSEEEDIWNYFARLHEVKNQVFEGCITDTTRSLFD